MSDTPETDTEAFKSRPPFYFVPADFARRLERQIAEAREENARLREALEKIKRRHCIMGSTGDYRQGQLDALEVTRTIAGLALTQTNT